MKFRRGWLLALTLLATVHAAPITQRAQDMKPAARQQLFKVLMAGELDISRRVSDPLLLGALQKEGDAKSRQNGQASLSCNVMERIEALDARQKPLRDKFHASIQKKYKVSQQVIEAVLNEGQEKNWAF